MNTKIFHVEVGSLKKATELRMRSLSFSISLVDSYIENRPIGSLSVYLNEEQYKAVKNPSGYYVFSDIHRGIYTLHVVSEFYFEESLDVDPHSLDPLCPVKEIRLIPTPAYPFPSGATLIRGRVLDSNKKPVSSAFVEIREKNLRSLTTPREEFYFIFSIIEEK